MKPDGSERKLVLGNAYSPSWSPDGKQLVVVREGSLDSDSDGTALAIVDADGSGARTLDLGEGENVHLVSAPEWSPDGKLIAFVDGAQNIKLVTPEGKAAPLGPVAAEGNGLSWSPDSSRLAFDRYVETKDGGRLVAVVLDVATGREAVFTGEQHGAQSPTWSPEGDQVAFLSLSERSTPSTTFHSCGSEGFASELWVMGPDGTKAHRLVKGEYYGPPSWARSLETDGGPVGRHRARAAAASGPGRGHRSRATAASGTGTPRRCRSRRREAQAREHQAARPLCCNRRPDRGARLGSRSTSPIPTVGPRRRFRTPPTWSRRRGRPTRSSSPSNASERARAASGRSGRTAPIRNSCSRTPRCPPGRPRATGSTPCGTSARGSCEPEDEAANVLFSVRPDGKDVRRVEAGEDVDREFAWAPDGDAIGFFADENASDPGTFDSSAATWSPDGFWVAFVGSVGPFDDETATAPPPYGLWLVSADGGTPRLLVKGASGRPSWAR